MEDSEKYTLKHFSVYKGVFTLKWRGDMQFSVTSDAMSDNDS